MSVVSIRSCVIILGDFSHLLLVLYEIFSVWMSHIGIPLCIRLQIGVDICAGTTGDAVVTSEVSCYYFTVRLHSYSQLVVKIFQMYVAQCSELWLARLIQTNQTHTIYMFGRINSEMNIFILLSNSCTNNIWKQLSRLYLWHCIFSGHDDLKG